MLSLQKYFNSFQWIAGLVLLLICVPFISIGAYETISTQQQLNTFVAARGTVVDNSYYTTETDGVTSGAYKPVIEFTAADGEKIRFTDSIGSEPPDYEVGDPVDVVYNPKNVKEARINSWERMWLASTLLISIGLLPILVFVVWMLMARRARVK
ncbi:MAG: DUF3592 domain-containing protein [Chloroflexi bacterium]|nr:DUF3592 domain-containing protein [Chloroflexota bacterium]